MRSITSSPAARRLFASSIVARLPLAMLSIGLMVHVRHLSGSFATAGVVTGAYALAESIGGPLLGRLVDRRGQTLVLLTSAGASAALLGVIAIVPPGTSLPALVALASGIGLAEPPVGACLRTQLSSLLPDPDGARAAYAFEASVVELTWVAGPPLVLGVGALWSSGAALASGGLLLLVATGAFAAQPASRAWRPAGAQGRRRGGALRTPAMRTLTAVLLLVGVLLGADEIAVTAAAKALDGTTAAAPLLALWGVGSLVGGLLITRSGGGARTAAGLSLVLAALAAGHLALIPASSTILSLGTVLLLAGTAIAPAEASVNAMVDDAAPPGTTTEAFAWLASAIAVGGALGAGSAGMLIDSAGPTAAFVLAGGAGALAVLVAALRSRTLAARPTSAGIGDKTSSRAGRKATSPDPPPPSRRPQPAVSHRVAPTS
jgi:MFS family permease